MILAQFNFYSLRKVINRHTGTIVYEMLCKTFLLSGYKRQSTADDKMMDPPALSE